VSGGKPIAVLLQSISGVSAVNPLVAFYDMLGEARFFYFVPDTTRDYAGYRYYFFSDARVPFRKNSRDFMYVLSFF
jgi:hypothetical protein